VSGEAKGLDKKSMSPLDLIEIDFVILKETLSFEVGHL
jgi:hypothetical protein